MQTQQLNAYAQQLHNNLQHARKLLDIVEGILADSHLACEEAGYGAEGHDVLAAVREDIAYLENTVICCEAADRK